MITLQQFLETVNYKITEGTEYLWKCYGQNSYILDSFDRNVDGYNASIIFDTETQEVYETTIFDNKNDRCYRMINPYYIKKYKKECKKRKVNDKQAYDTVNYIDLETEEDFLEKLTAIVSGEEYDERVSIPIDITDSELAHIARAAHEADMTLNEFFEQAMIDFVEKHKIKSKLQKETPCKEQCGNYMCDSDGCIYKGKK